MARTRQPQGAITVNRGNPLAAGLTHLYTSGLPVDFAKNAVLSGPNLDPLPGPLGMYGGNASGTKYRLLDDSLSTTEDLTVGALFFANATAAAQAVFCRTLESGLYPQNWNLYVYNGQIRFQGSHDSYAAVGADIVAGTPYLVVGRHINSSREWSIWLNGIKVQYRTAVGVLDTSGVTQTTQIGAGNGGAIPLNGGVYLAVGYKRALDDSEIVSLSANPWQLFAPQRRLWIQLGAAAGGTTTEATLSATVTASLLGSRAISVTRSAASATGAATTRAISTIKSTTTTASSVLARAVAKIVSAATTTVATIANQVTSGAQTFYRELTAATAAGALALRQSNLTRSTTAAASALTLRAVGVLRVATQTATATQTSIKIKLKELAATGVAASAALTRAVATTRLASAVLSASATLRVGVYLSVAASAVATRLAAVAHTFSVATATAAATVTTLKVKLKNLATDVVSTTATLTRQTLAQRVATLAGTATAQRAISSTLAATQPVTAVAVKAISKTLAVAASALATLVRQLLSGSFWSADRTYTIAAAPRTYTIAAAPRTYTIAAAPRIYTV